MLNLFVPSFKNSFIRIDGCLRLESRNVLNELVYAFLEDEVPPLERLGTEREIVMEACKMQTINKQIFSWIETGKVKEAIIGKKDYFIPDVTYRERHDRCLIIRQLFLWNEYNNDELNITEIIRELILEFKKLNEIHEILDLVFSLSLVKKDMGLHASNDMSVIENELITIFKNYINEIVIDESFRCKVISISNYLPGFKNFLGL